MAPVPAPRRRCSLLGWASVGTAALLASQAALAFLAPPSPGARPSLRASSAPRTAEAFASDGGARPDSAAGAGAFASAWGLFVGAGVVSALAANGRRAESQAKARRTAVPLARRALPRGGYCEAAESCVRRPTRTVNIGSVKIGSEHPVAVQTMATTLTSDVEATVAQIKKCADQGVDIVRITVQGMKEAKACEHIKRRLLEDGYHTPLVADIHFTPKVALVAAEHVDKIRVNPGNFVDGRKSFDNISELTEQDVREAQAAIEEALVPLVLKLKERGKAMRIGVNHGSLSERILFQYGDSPEGMVASAVEFGDICRKYDYHNFCFSMKSSNPQVMVRAYRMLVKEMYKRGWDYPVHLGVTEAGGGSDGRIKSAVGIGALLIDGIGDTVRVSLTEDPEYEIGPCRTLRAVAESALGSGVAPFAEPEERKEGKLTRRGQVDFPLDVPLNADGTVLTRMPAEDLQSMPLQQLCDRLGLRLRADGDVQKDWTSVDVVVVDGPITAELQSRLRTLLDVPLGILCRSGPHVPEGATVLHDAAEALGAPVPERLGGRALVFSGAESEEEIREAVANAKPRFLLLKPSQQQGRTFQGRRFFAALAASETTKRVPVMLWFDYPQGAAKDEEEAVIRASADYGSLFVDGLGEGVLWDAADVMAPTVLRESTFNLLQASRMRISKTEYISCPSCGRTLFDLQETTAKIQARTGHLPGVRIAVMGCIVNGPGEMADADFGYVGSGVGKVDLYVGYTKVTGQVKSEEAVDRLVDLLKEHGRWIDPPAEDAEDQAVDQKQLVSA